MSIGFPRRLWTLGTGFSSLAVLYVTIGVRERFGLMRSCIHSSYSHVLQRRKK